jgi:hypothetical protein
MKLFIAALVAFSSVSASAVETERTSVGNTFDSQTIGSAYPESSLRPLRQVECRADDLTLTTSGSDIVGGAYNISRKGQASQVSASDLQTNLSGTGDEVNFEKIEGRQNMKMISHTVEMCFVTIESMFTQKVKLMKVNDSSRVGKNVGDVIELSCREVLRVPHYFCRS